MTDAENNAERPKKVSRRDFLKISTLATAGVALSPLGLKNTQTVNATPLTIESLQSENIEVYGSPDNPLTFEQYKAVVDKLNKDVVEGKVEKLPNKLYYGMVITQDQAKNFQYDGGYVKYVKNLDIAANATILSANNHIINSGQQVAGIECEGVFFVANGISPEPSASHHLGFLTENNPYKRIDGWFGRYWGGLQDPRSEGWWNEEYQINMGDVHELKHSALGHEPDEYELDFATESNECVPLINIDEEWQKYFTWERTDSNGSNIMNLPDKPLESSFASWMLAKHLKDGTLHNLRETIPGSHGFPPELAKSNVLNFGDAYKGKKIEIYRSDGDYTAKELIKVGEGTIDKNGELDIGNPWHNAGQDFQGRTKVPGYKGTLFIKVTGEDPSNPEFAWTDIRIFAEAHEKLNRAEAIRYRFALANNNMTKAEYDWASQEKTEVILPPEPPPDKPGNKVFLPQIQSDK